MQPRQAGSCLTHSVTVLTRSLKLTDVVPLPHTTGWGTGFGVEGGYIKVQMTQAGV